jgi:hypothetical protein
MRPSEIDLDVVQAGTKPVPSKIAKDKRIRSRVDELVAAVVKRQRVTAAGLLQI